MYIVKTIADGEHHIYYDLDKFARDYINDPRFDDGRFYSTDADKMVQIASEIKDKHHY